MSDPFTTSGCVY